LKTKYFYQVVIAIILHKRYRRTHIMLLINVLNYIIVVVWRKKYWQKISLLVFKISAFIKSKKLVANVHA